MVLPDENNYKKIEKKEIKKGRVIIESTINEEIKLNNLSKKYNFFFRNPDFRKFFSFSEINFYDMKKLNLKMIKI
jgi:hypothetical protein